VQDVLGNPFSKSVLENPLLTGAKAKAGTPLGQARDDLAVEKDGLPDLGLSADDDDDPGVGLAGPLYLPEHGQHVEAVLNHRQEAIAEMLAI
jgi:hypothetical protein